MKSPFGTPKRRALLAAGLVATIGAAAFAPGDEPAKRAAPTAAARKSAPAPAAAPAPMRAEVPPLTKYDPESRFEKGLVPDMFEPRIAPAAAKPAPPPVVPPFPYTLLGIVGRGAEVRVFLAEGERIVEAKPGEAFGQYRLEPLAGEDLVFTYLPLNAQHRISATATK